MMTIRHSFVGNPTKAGKINGGIDTSAYLTVIGMLKLKGYLTRLHKTHMEPKGWEQRLCYCHETVTSFWTNKGYTITVRVALTSRLKPIVSVTYWSLFYSRNVHHVDSVRWNSFNNKILKYVATVEAQLPD